MSKNKYPLPYNLNEYKYRKPSKDEMELRKIIRKQYNKKIPKEQTFYDLTREDDYYLDSTKYYSHDYLENMDDSIGGVTGKHDIKNYEFEGGKFTNNLFEGSDLEKVTFRRMRLKNTHFLNCILSECNFYQTSDSKGSFVDSFILACVFKDYTAYMTDFKGARLQSVRFERCDLRKARNLKLLNKDVLSNKQISNLLDQELSRGDRLHFEKLLLTKI